MADKTALKNLALVVGARPNFIKAAPLLRALKAYRDSLRPVLIHTGQHFDRYLFEILFRDLDLPEPDIDLKIGSETPIGQTAAIMIGLEREFQKNKPDLVVVFGDVTSTLAAALAAAKMNIPIAHIEAGLRSFDTRMPEEINRKLTDHMAAYHFISESSGWKNLVNEGLSEKSLYLVGNIMIDSLEYHRAQIEASLVLERLNLTAGQYGVLTLHRPASVDDEDQLRAIMTAVGEISARLKIVFPCHPRTGRAMGQAGLIGEVSRNLVIVEPLGYTDFLRMVMNSVLVLTDSGGVQEETTYLGKTCLTLRNNTERPVTVEVGTNQVIGVDSDNIVKAAKAVISGKKKQGRIPEFWDGKTANRIAEILFNKMTGS